VAAGDFPPVPEGEDLPDLPGRLSVAELGHLAEQVLGEAP
jgi:hypothetical protein